jgi:NADH:ubiquinone oxidoreductase subunit 3 (subunit A)
MEFIYTYNIQTYIIFLVPIILSSILIILNRIFSKLIKLKSISTERSVTRGYETYEFGTHSIGSISTMSNNQFIILAILFLIFDVELIYIIP